MTLSSPKYAIATVALFKLNRPSNAETRMAPTMDASIQSSKNFFANPWMGLATSSDGPDSLIMTWKSCSYRTNNQEDPVISYHKHTAHTSQLPHMLHKELTADSWHSPAGRVLREADRNPHCHGNRISEMHIRCIVRPTRILSTFACNDCSTLDSSSLKRTPRTA